MDIRKFSLDKRTIIIICGIVLGFLLLFLSGFYGNSHKTPADNDLNSYIEWTEERLCRVVSNISGAGSTKVFITVQNTFETVYASNTSIDENGNERNTKRSIAYASDSDKDDAPVIVKQLCPKISGVLIVCEGGSDGLIKKEITDAVSVAIGISANKIHVTGGTSLK